MGRIWTHYLVGESGQGQWIEMGYGYWTILFPGFPGPGGWHVDHLETGYQGLVRLFLFSDMGPMMVEHRWFAARTSKSHG
jgi:hypothetical protein